MEHSNKQDNNRNNSSEITHSGPESQFLNERPSAELGMNALREDGIPSGENGQIYCLPTNQIPSHIEGQENCRCGCIPTNMMSLFQMAELRKKYREAQKKKEEGEK